MPRATAACTIAPVLGPRRTSSSSSRSSATAAVGVEGPSSAQRRPAGAAPARRPGGRPSPRCIRRPPGTCRLRGGRGAAEGDRAAGLRLQRQRRHSSTCASEIGPTLPTGAALADRREQRAQPRARSRRAGVDGAFVGGAAHDGLDRRVPAPQVGAAQGADAGRCPSVGRLLRRSAQRRAARSSAPGRRSACRRRSGRRRGPAPRRRPPPPAAPRGGSVSAARPVAAARSAFRPGLRTATAAGRRRNTARPPLGAVRGQRPARVVVAYSTTPPSHSRPAPATRASSAFSTAGAVGQHHVDLGAQHACGIWSASCTSWRASASAPSRSVTTPTVQRS